MAHKVQYSGFKKKKGTKSLISGVHSEDGLGDGALPLQPSVVLPPQAGSSPHCSPRERRELGQQDRGGSTSEGPPAWRKTTLKPLIWGP